MLRFCLEFIAALAAERLCERIRPTQVYTWQAQVRINNGPWQRYTVKAIQRRPWQPRISSIPIHPPMYYINKPFRHGDLTEVTQQAIVKSE